MDGRWLVKLALFYLGCYASVHSAGMETETSISYSLCICIMVTSCFVIQYCLKCVV